MPDFKSGTMLTRGSKTAAEKVVRESEGPDMGSPDKRECISPVTDVEDSPLFKYLCNLSPIKPAKAVHHAQTYNELTFPPEPRIFASPRSSRRSSNSSLKRVVAAELLSAQAQAEGRESLGWHSTNSRSTISDNAPSPSLLNRDQQVTPCSRRQAEEVPASQSNSAKNENDAFTVEDLVGQGMFALNPMNPESSDRTAVTAASFQSQFTDFEELDPVTIVECLNGALEKEGGTSADVVERRQSTSSSLSQDCVLPGNLIQESKCLEQRPNEDHGLNFSKETSELDHDTTAMAYFLAGNEALGQDKGEWSEDSSDLVALNEEAGKQETDLLDVMASQSGLDLSSQNRLEDVASENANLQHSLLSHRADTAGQRGFRRRCLDFDASGARRKSLGSMGNRKSLGSRLKDCSGASVADDNNASPVLDNAISTTSAATASTPANNSSPNANDTSRAEIDSVTHTRGAPACGDALGVMTKTHQQLPSRSYENNVDVLNAKAGESRPQKPQNSGVNPPAEGVRRSPRVRRTGIGLHLNSLTSSMSFKRDYPSNGGESAKRVLATSLGLQPVASATPKEHCQGGGSGHPNQSLDQGVPSLLKERRSQLEMNSRDAAAPLGNETVEIPTPDFRSLNIENLPPLEESLTLTPIPNLPRLVSPRGQKRSHPHRQELGQQGEEETVDDLLDSPQSSKRRRLSRRKPTAPSQGEKPADGCKRCNCKKSKCLKLYCECFAAGIYCVGSCACRHCFNKPEYEDTVRNTRMQIESRNPLAFAPKIVQAAEASPVPGDETLDTPASARHKRGCNCKKSLCLKKYCECFQAGVGCSEGCRCEGCKNVYGRKEGPMEGEEKEGEQAISSREESQLDEPVELFSRMNGNIDRLQDCAKPNLSPITPGFEHDGHGRSMLRLRSTGRKRISSDEHCVPPLAPHVSKPPKSSTNFSNTLDSFDLVPHPPQGDADFSLNGSGESPMTTPTFARIGHASTRWEGLTDLCSLTPLPLTTTLEPTPGSSCVTSERPGASPAFSSQRTESPHHAASSSSEHHHASSRTWSPHSPRFRQPAPRSPLRFDTPRQSLLPSPDQQLAPAMQSPLITAEKSLQSDLESAKVGAPDDESTLDVLKCHEDQMSSPSRSIVSTKSISPKQKRVTPPRHGGRELQGGMLPSPPGLRNSKRFILQALPPVAPSFPNG